MSCSLTCKGCTKYAMTIVGATREYYGYSRSTFIFQLLVPNLFDLSTMGDEILHFSLYISYIPICPYSISREFCGGEGILW